MYLFRRLLFSQLFFALTLASIAQQKYPKTLLWRISGKGLQKPSYLFGTMHLNDKRLFRFSDSVYKAIETSSGLAIEVNPDEMAAYYVNQSFDEAVNKQKLSSVIKDKDFKKYSSALSKKFNKPASEITTTDVVKEKNKWISDYLEKGEMPTFLDAYLYNIARKQGKWLGGIEDIMDQAGLLEDLVDKSDIDYLLAGDKANKSAEDNSLESMIKLYSNEDIDGIENMLANTSAKEKDLLLVKRNIKMARRMDSLSTIRTMFFAVGVAHLPGDDGVIENLRKRGFTVEPVMCTSKKDAGDYHFKEVNVPWVEVKDEQGLYNVSLPANPANLKLMGLFNMKFLVDISDISGFCTMAVASAGIFTNPDSMFNGVITNMFKNVKINKPKNLDQGDVLRREYIQTKDHVIMRVQLMIYKRVLYMAFKFGLKEEALRSPETERFFKSFTVNKSALIPASKAYHFSDSVMGVSLDAPAMLEYNKKLGNSNLNGWKVSIFAGSDFTTGAYVMLISKEVNAGSFITSNTETMQDLYKNMATKYKGLQQEQINVAGYNSLNMFAKNQSEQKLAVRMMTTIKANRNITLIVIADSVIIKSPGIENVFSSFAFLPYQNMNWQKHMAPDSSFTTWAPAAVYNYTSRDTTDKRQQFVTYDTASATTYSIILDTLDKYTWAKSDSDFVAARILADELPKDSVISIQDINNGALKGKELTIKHKNADTYKKIRVILNGNILYTLFTAGDSEQVFNNADASKFFSTFKLPGQNSYDITKSKAALILHDIESEDSATRQKAYTALTNANFGGEDIFLLHDAILKSYKSLNDDEGAYEINTAIANVLIKIKSPETVAFAKDHYSSFIYDTVPFNNLALRILSGIHTKESYKTLAEILLKQLPLTMPDYFIKSNLKDSLGLTADIYPSLIKLAKDSMWGPSMASIALTLLDSNIISNEIVASSEKDYIALAQKLLPALKKKTNDFDYNIYSLVKLLAKMNTPASLQILNNYLQVHNDFLRHTVVTCLLEKNKPVEPAVLNVLASRNAIRTDLYEGLKKLQKQALFPKQYLNRKSFAQSLVYAAASDDDDPSSIEFISEKNAACKGKKYVFFLYKVKYGTGKDATNYLGIGGGYKLASNSFETESDFSGIYFNEPYNVSKISGLLSAYLKQWHTENNEEGEE